MRRLNANCEYLLINNFNSTFSFSFSFSFISIKNVNSIIDNFKIVVDKISFLLKNEISIHLLKFKNNKNKIFNHLQNNFVKFITKLIIIYLLT